MVKFVRLTREEYKLEKGEILSMRENLSDKDKNKKYSSFLTIHRKGVETKNVTFQTGNKM